MRASSARATGDADASIDAGGATAGSFDTMGDVDQGALRIAVNKALKALTNDLADRPVLDKARKMVIEVQPKAAVSEAVRRLCQTLTGRTQAANKNSSSIFSFLKGKKQA